MEDKKKNDLGTYLFVGLVVLIMVFAILLIIFSLYTKYHEEEPIDKRTYPTVIVKSTRGTTTTTTVPIVKGLKENKAHKDYETNDDLDNRKNDIYKTDDYELEYEDEFPSSLTIGDTYIEEIDGMSTIQSIHRYKTFMVLELFFANDAWQYKYLLIYDYDGNLLYDTENSFPQILDDGTFLNSEPADDDEDNYYGFEYSDYKYDANTKVFTLHYNREYDLSDGYDDDGNLATDNIYIKNYCNHVKEKDTYYEAYVSFTWNKDKFEQKFIKGSKAKENKDAQAYCKKLANINLK